MRNGFLGSIAALVSGAGLALGQSPAPPGPELLPSAVAPPAATGAFPPGYPVAPAGVPLAALPTDDEPPAPSADAKAGATSRWEHFQHALFGANEAKELPRASKGGAAAAIIPSPDEVKIAYRAWARAEYLLWYFNPGVATPPLATTGPASSFGIRGQNGVATVLGGSQTQYDDLNGTRLSAGVWLDEDAHMGVEASWFMLYQNTVSRTLSSDPTGAPLLARPVFDAVTQQNGVQLVAFPGALTGQVRSSASSELWGVNVDFIGSEWRGKHVWADLIVGMRYLDLEEALTVSSSATVLGNGTAAFLGNRLGTGNTVGIVDNFKTRNQFYGGEVGLRAEACLGRFFVNALGKLSIGNNHEVVMIDGGSTLAGPAGNVAVPGGLLAVSTNSRIHSRDEFTLIPEFNVKVGAYINCHFNVFVGYNYMYWSDVVRPGNQPSLVINPTVVPSNLAFGANIAGPALPAAIIKRTDFWAQGLNVGMEFRY